MTLDWWDGNLHMRGAVEHNVTAAASIASLHHLLRRKECLVDGAHIDVPAVVMSAATVANRLSVMCEGLIEDLKTSVVFIL